MNPGEKLSFVDYLYPDVTTVIITNNSSQSIALTLDRVLSQAYPSYEIIVVDAGSTDRTHEIINSYLDSRVRLVSVTEYDPYEMLNKGISLAKGEYINFLSPGDYYLSEKSNKKMMDLALTHNKPLLVYGASLLRFGDAGPKILYRPLTLELLRQGRQPTSLQAMWFHRDFFKRVGKFKHKYRFRGEYDLLCTFIQLKEKTFASTTHVVMDFDFRLLRGETVWLHFKETLSILYKHFGLGAVMKWLWTQKDLKRTISMIWGGVKASIMGS